ncbi:uncharacterized protein LOC124405506 isoform X2 [Diprion similis]|uniref:uncharacterized protein LOC124405506 isoform X2 n=1 Tax=Diprion similis TaxID=362088 RepID=UPI001EF95066|nr:uncharacterized protein LOC124405506 isoform X2 [Diprion similis]
MNFDEQQKSTHFDPSGNEGQGGRKRRYRKRKRRPEKNLALMFTSSKDPFAQPLRWWEKDPIKYAFSYSLVRSRLEMLMGTNVVRLTDRRYMQKLIIRIRQDYEASQQERVAKRVTNELMRTKKMILERLIPVQEAPEELRRYPLFQLYLYCDAIIEEKQRKRMPKKVHVTNSLYQMLYPDNTGDKVEEEAEDDEVYMKTEVVHGAQKLVPMTTEEIAVIMTEQEKEKDIENGYLLTQEDYDRLYFETEAIKELREMQSVEEMYTKAQEIVGILYSYADEGRYQKAALEKQQREAQLEAAAEFAKTVSSADDEAAVTSGGALQRPEEPGADPGAAVSTAE